MEPRYWISCHRGCVFELYRGELLDQLGGRLARPDGRFQVLAGLGGAGKTTVALALAARAQDEGRPVWWISAADAESVRASLIALASELGAPVREVEGALSGTCDPSEVLWRRLKQRSGWLLVLDNADDPGELAIAGAPAGDGTGWLRSTRAGPFLLRAAGPRT